MASDEPHDRRRRRADRERVARTLIFWRRPQFVLRVVSRLQKGAGFDRSIASRPPVYVRAPVELWVKFIAGAR